MSSAICLNLDQSKILQSGNGFRKYLRSDQIESLQYNMYQIMALFFGWVENIGLPAILTLSFLTNKVRNKERNE